MGDMRNAYGLPPTPSPAIERERHRSSFRPTMGYGMTPSQDSSAYRHTPRKIDYSMDQDDMNTTSRSDFSSQEVDDAVASEFPNVSALLGATNGKSPSARTPFDRFAIDTTESPLTTSDLDMTTTNDFRLRSAAKPPSSYSSFSSAPLPNKAPLFSSIQDEDMAPAYPTPFSQHAPPSSFSSFSSYVPSQSIYKATESQFSSSIPTVSKLGFSSVNGNMEDRPDEDEFYGELFDFFKNFRKRAPPTVATIELSKTFAELCDARAEQLLQSLPTYSSIMPSHEQLKEKTGINLVAERNTWMLLYHLNVDRDTRLPPTSYSPSQVQIVETAMTSDPALKKNMVVLHWLESLYSHIFGEQESSVWPNTLYGLQQVKEAGGKGKDKDYPFIRHMDPDAPCRENKSLHPDDAKEEEMICEALWGFYRGGKSSSAHEFCNNSGQPWRAASLLGGNLYNNEMETGNPTRTAWKNACCELARNGCTNAYERAVYGILSQDIESVLPVCRTWEDHLWANLKVWADAYLDDILQNYAHPFAENEEKRKFPYSVGANKTIKDILEELKCNPRIDPGQGLNERYHEVQRYIILGDHAQLLQRLFEWTQENNNTTTNNNTNTNNYTVTKTTNTKKNNNNNNNNVKSPEFLRFAAHVVLALRYRAHSLSLSPPSLSLSSSPSSSSSALFVWEADPRSDAVIEAYVRYLIDAKKHDYVALYTSFLPPRTQIETYASFLSQKTLRDNKDEKQHLLDKADEAGLDTKNIILRVAELNIHQRDSEPSSALVVLDKPAASLELTESDKRKLKAIEWLCFDDSQIVDALMQSNIVVHEFLEAGKMEAVSKLISGPASILPPNIVTLVLSRVNNQQQGKELEVIVREHLAYKTLLEAHDKFNSWNSHHISPPEAPLAPVSAKRSSAAGDIAYEVQMRKFKDTLYSWQQQDLALADTARAELTSLIYFEHGWLCSLEPTGRQYQNIRKRYIPEAIFMLHRVLHETGRYKSSVGIARKVASEKWKLYAAFNQGEIQKLLKLIEESAKALLASGFTDPTGYSLQASLSSPVSAMES